MDDAAVRACCSCREWHKSTRALLQHFPPQTPLLAHTILDKRTCQRTSGLSYNLAPRLSTCTTYRNCPVFYLVSTVPRLPRPRRAATRSDAISRAGCLQVNCQFANDWPVPRAASRTRHGRTTPCSPSASVSNQPNCLQCNSAPLLLLFAYPIPNSSKLPSRATTFITQSTTNTTNFPVRVHSLWMRVPRT